MSLTTQAPPNPASGPGVAHYSLAVILGIWASVTIPMALLAFVAAPALIARTSVKPGLVFWMLMVAGMMWQFVVSVVVLRLELGTLRWSVVRARIWLNRPLDPRTGELRRALWAWAVPAIGANVVGGMLAARLDHAWRAVLAGLPEPGYTAIAGLADPSLKGQWWILALALTSCLFNYLLGEELLFRGVLLPRMGGVFGRWDWVANTVLFGLYHLHKIWYLPTILLSSFGFAWATRRYRSLWLGVITHGIEGFFIVLVLGVILGTYP